MLDNQSITELYQALATLKGDMRIAAEQGEWDKLVTLNERCQQQISDIQTCNDTAPTDESERQQVAQLIRQILADDAEIRDRTEAWVAQLQHLMQSTRQELRLNQAYGAM